ncbi:MAG: hypothetical protein OSW71_10670, partial [Proteobacteria bacterium]|nr:hypothetical protein [Pseudomonadota bacterium]
MGGIHAAAELVAQQLHREAFLVRGDRAAVHEQAGSRLPSHLATTIDLEYRENHSIVQIGGLVVCRQRPGTAKGITFLLMEDELGLANVIVYPDLYQQNRLVVRGEPFLLVEGKLQREEGVINIIAHKISPLDAARESFDVPSPDVYEDVFPETTVTREAL